MKKFLYICISICSLFFVSCEEEITLDFEKNSPRLVIEGNIFVGEPQFNRIHLSTTTDFYSDIFPTVNNATVSVEDLTTNVVYNFSNNGKGNFTNENFLPAVGSTYELTVMYNNETYKGASTLLSSPTIINVDQKNDGGFMGDSYEINFNFQDNADQENYYLVQMISPVDTSFSVTNDQFTNGNLMSDLYFYDKEDLKQGDQLTHYITSISKEYYNYLSKLLSISGESGNPFASPSGTIKGNMVNTNNKDRFALGFFNISQRNQHIYIVK